MQRRYFAIVLFLASLWSPTILWAQNISRLPLQAVSLYSPEMWKKAVEARNSNRGCGERLVGQKVHAACHSLMPDKWTIAVHQSPQAGSPKLGTILVQISPKKGFVYSYRAQAWKRYRVFEPDLICRPLEADCIAEQTVLERQGDWLRLPPGPFVSTGWINLKADWNIEARVREMVEAGRSYRLGRAVRATRQTTGNNQFLNEGEEIFVKKFEDGTLIVRRALPGDAVCRPKDEAPPGSEVPDYALHMGELYDGRGHLKISPAYWDYCQKPGGLEKNLKVGDPTIE